MTVRERVLAYQRELRQDNLLPARAREILMEIEGLIGIVMTELREAEMAYNVVLLAHLDGSEAANRATIRAQTTPAYQRFREAKDVSVFVTSLKSSLKAMLRSLQEEMRLAS